MSAEEFFKEHVCFCLDEAESEIKKYNENRSIEYLTNAEQILESAKSAYTELLSNDLINENNIKTSKYKDLHKRINTISTHIQKCRKASPHNDSDFQNSYNISIETDDSALLGEEVLNVISKKRKKNIQVNKIHKPDNSSTTHNNNKTRNFELNSYTISYFLILILVVTTLSILNLKRI